tara:strand:- start:590 stop:4912 length:4323 start_codon:yes stop_codon:yes gene_type:complete
MSLPTHEQINTGRPVIKESLSHKMTRMCDAFLDKIRLAKDGVEIDDELETRFKGVSKIDHDNVVKKLISLGFVRQPVVTSLNILVNDGYRIPITGEQNVYNYCNTNNIKSKMYESTERKVRIERLDFLEAREFPFNFTHSLEQKVSKSEQESIKSRFNEISKIFRYMRRVSFTHENYPYLVIDLSTVKQSSKGQSFISSFANQDTYEIEIEFKKDRADYFKGTQAFSKELQLTDATIKKTVVANFKKYIKFVLGGIQQSNYPISIAKQESALKEYITVLDKSQTEDSRKSVFIGPSPKTLQIDNIVDKGLAENLKVPNIRVPGAFCVTEKADGDRHLMFINAIGEIYLITSNMQIKFTGAKCEYRNTIIDGELILHNKNKEFINTYAAFDLYYLNGEDVRFLKFIPIPRPLEENLKKMENKDSDLDSDSKDDKSMATTYKLEKWKDKYRLVLLNEVMSAIRLKMAAETASGSSFVGTSSMVFRSKTFYPTIEQASLSQKPDIETAYNIFRASNAILDTEFVYETDGLIFTHTSFGVGEKRIGFAGPLQRVAWDYALKWKPAKLNTNDFLVITQKDKTKGGDLIVNKFQEGTDMQSAVQMSQYKHLQLFCGNRSQSEIFAHPCEDMYNGVFPSLNQSEFRKNNKYQPTPFVPTNPFDANAAYSSILLNKDGLMITEEGEPFESDTIVEFRYDMEHRKWIALRVRYDKTSEYKNGKPQYGNAFETANSNWSSIHNPITEYMISHGKNKDGTAIIEMDQDSDAYYKNESDQNTQTRGLRDFHNKYVKQWLIKSVCRPGNTLIDFACGRGGDLQKWIHAQLSFVYGIDFSEKGLTDLRDGACARYLNDYKTFRRMPAALFVHGDSGKNIVSGSAMFNEKGKKINDVIFGERIKGTTHNATTLGKGVMNQANKGKDGFNVSSCQFAMHYMFATPSTFYNFVENIAECTKNGGFFISTCYDGAQIFNLLKDKPKESIVKGSKLVWEVVKKYDSERTIFPEDETSLGMEISVYQESFNSWQSEYLVSSAFFEKTMNEYGMYLLTDAELREINFPIQKSTGLFGDLFNAMTSQAQSNSAYYGTAAKMQEYEKQISFLNRYFIYKSRNHTKKDFARITATKLSKYGLPEDTGSKELGPAMTESKMTDPDTEPELCRFDDRLQNVLYKITKEKNKQSENIAKILQLIKSGENSSEKPSVGILENIDEMLKKYKTKSDPNKGKEYICGRIVDYFEQNLRRTPMMTKETRVIDIGGGNGNLLHCFSEKYGIPKDNLVSIENGSFEYEYTHNDTVSYKTLSPSDQNNINNLSDKVFKNADFIFCMVTMHHMTDQNIINTAKFIQSHLIDGGYLIIKEHDTDTRDTKCLIDWEHHLYRLMEHDAGNMPTAEIQKYIDNIYIGNYKPEAYFDKLFESMDLSLVATLNHVMYPLEMGGKKWERNPTQMYWKIYKYK